MGLWHDWSNYKECSKDENYYILIASTYPNRVGYNVNIKRLLKNIH
jgi:hypothetical protein